MPTSVVNDLMRAVKSLHDDVIVLKNDNMWIKRGLIGIYGLFGASIVAVVGTWMAR